jgi:hypothetical protein
VIEQQVAERFRAVVDDEPPFALTPEELVDRLLRRKRRRQGLATALSVVVAAVGGAALLGGTGRPPAAAPTIASSPAPAPTVPPSTADVRISATVPVGSRAVLPAGREDGVRAVSEFLVDSGPADQGTVEIRRDDQVLFRSQLAGLDAHRFRPELPVVLKPGQRVVVAVSCRLSGDDGCRVDVTFSAPPAAR